MKYQWTPQGPEKDWGRTGEGLQVNLPAKCPISSPPPVHFQSTPHGVVHVESTGISGLHEYSIRMQLIIAHSPV